MASPHLVLDNVCVELGGARILQDVSLTVAEREFVCVIGTSGGGKTTLLRTIAGLLPVTSGSVSLDGAPVDGPSPRAAVVFQHFGLFPWKTVRSNIAYGLRVQGRRVDPDLVRRMLEILRLTDVADYYPAQLSGGMKQRVGIARALATEPEVLLLDEPFSSLDAITRESLQNEVLRLWEANANMTALQVTHDIDEALLMADRVIVVSGPPGRITFEMKVDLPRPRDSQEIRSHQDYPRMRKLLWDSLNSPPAAPVPAPDAAPAREGAPARERAPARESTPARPHARPGTAPLSEAT
jgi:NitT/TauT family transport system ATP-binding protein